MGNGRSRGGLYAAMAAIAVTIGLGAVSAAGADEAANAEIYTRDGTGGAYCFSDDPAATECAAGETAEVTINAGETVTFRFGGSMQHDAAGTAPVAWRVPASGYAQPGQTHDATFTEPGTYAFACSLHPMTGTITVVGATPTPTPTPSVTPQPGGGVTPSPVGSGDTVKPTMRGVRATALRRAVRVRFRLSEPATVTVRVKRRGSRRVVKSARVQLRPGTRSVTLRKLKKGRYTVEIQARDACGNVSRLAKERLAL